MLNKALTSTCDVKSFSLRLKNGLAKYGVNIEHSKILEAVSVAFQFKNWNVLSSKLKNVSKQLTDQKTIILHVESSAKREQIDLLLKNAIISSKLDITPPSVIDEVAGISYVFELNNVNEDTFMTFITLMSNSIIDSKIIVKNIFLKKIGIETESLNGYFSSFLHEYQDNEIRKAFVKMENGESVFHSHEEAKKIINEKKDELKLKYNK